MATALKRLRSIVIGRRKPDGVIAERTSPVSGRVARLVRKDGKVVCECPYLCDATYETCEFAGKFDGSGRPL